MTKRQMLRAILKWNISLVYDNQDHLWWAGDARAGSTSDLGTKLQVTMDVSHAGSQHVAADPTNAVEDYCNARNLEWDV